MIMMFRDVGPYATIFRTVFTVLDSDCYRCIFLLRAVTQITKTTFCQRLWQRMAERPCSDEVPFSHYQRPVLQPAVVNSSAVRLFPSCVKQ